MAPKFGSASKVLWETKPYVYIYIFIMRELFAHMCCSNMFELYEH